MKIANFGLLAFVFVMTGFLLTACGNSTSYISDQTGKEIPVTSSDSDTYTFKLPSEPKAETDESEENLSPEIPEEPVDSEVDTESIEEPPASEGPKTGEP